MLNELKAKSEIRQGASWNSLLRWRDEYIVALEDIASKEIIRRGDCEATLEALEQRMEGLERIKSAFEYLAIESESGVIETEAAEDGGLLSRAEHDKRIAQFIRKTLAAEEEA